MKKSAAKVFRTGVGIIALTLALWGCTKEDLLQTKTTSTIGIGI